MDPAQQPDQKRPRLETNPALWRSNNTLPQPNTPHQQPQPQHQQRQSGSGAYHQSPYSTPRSAEGSLPPPLPHPHDSRHHEHAHYSPIQDPSRQHLSPARSGHPNNYPYPPTRDPGMKREMYEDAYPKRPQSTGAAPPDGAHGPGMPPPPPPSHSTPATPHAPHAHPPPPSPSGQGYPEDPRRHMSYDGAPHAMPHTPVAPYKTSYPPQHPPSHPPPPQHHQQQQQQQQQHPPPPPPHMAPPQPQYEQQAQYQPPPPGPDPSLYNPPVTHAPSSQASQKRKATRASQACDYCRQLKAKCDEMKPCKTCKEKNQECKYRESVPKTNDKSQADILDAIAQLGENLSKRLDSMDRKLKYHDQLLAGDEVPPKKRIKLEADAAKALSPVAATPASQTSSIHMMDVVRTPQQQPQPQPAQHATPQPAYTPADDYDEHGPLDADEHTDEEQDDERHQDPPGNNLQPGLSAIPVNHTVSAGMLLTWPAIMKLTNTYLARMSINWPQDFPQVIEENRGVLRPYGRGEAYASLTKELSRQDPSDPGILDTEADNFSDHGSSPAAYTDWGQVGSLSPAIDLYNSPNLTNGSPDFSSNVIDLYIASFKKHIIRLHPIIFPQRLDNCVKKFKQDVAPRPTKSASYASARFPNNNSNTLSAAPDDTNHKRKRTPPGETPDPYSGAGGARYRKPFRTLDNALVLVALALGKLSNEKNRIPEVDSIPPPVRGPASSPSTRNGHPASPTQSSPPSSASDFMSPLDQKPPSASRRTSWQTQNATSSSQPRGQSIRKNIDVIPGLEYLALATDILGNYQGSKALRNIQANIFVALFYGQIAYPVQSCMYNTIAGLLLKFHISRRDKNSFQEMKRRAIQPSKPRDQIILLAYWSCLQLESDIVVELDTPRSGILEFEEVMPYPNFTECKWDQDIMSSYAAQLYARKQLNLVSRKLYSRERPQNDGPVSVEDIHALLIADPNAEYSWLTPQYKFTEDDPPPEDMLSARIRAKYWGFQVIISRPFVKMILDFGEFVQEGGIDEDIEPTFFRDSNVKAPNIPRGTKTYEEINPLIREYAKLGVRSLIKSTMAFHNIPDGRLILPNHFGTSMAQWGNLLVLIACHKNPWLSQYIDSETLRHLYDRTMQWIIRSAQPSSSVAHCYKMLAWIREEHLPSGPANMSFSSESNGPPGSIHPSPVPSARNILSPTMGDAPSYTMLPQPR